MTYSIDKNHHQLNTEEKWIHESPDGGKTVIRRPLNNHDPKYTQYKFNNTDGYVSHTDIKRYVKEMLEEEGLRKQHPALQEKYDEYRVLLEICKDTKKKV
jgi:hypothetical protein